jgi:rare lipoprotein A
VSISPHIPLRKMFAGLWFSRGATALMAISLATMIAGCGQLWSENSGSAYGTQRLAPPPVRSQATTTPAGRIVKASWYGPGFSGRHTASGERFDPNRMTAASKTLPIGSVVHVTNLETGRSVNVRINDRGPYVRGRSLDLSHGAARKIGLSGVARVRVTPVPRHSETPPASTVPVPVPSPTVATTAAAAIKAAADTTAAAQ